MAATATAEHPKARIIRLKLKKEWFFIRGIDGDFLAMVFEALNADSMAVSFWLIKLVLLGSGIFLADSAGG